MFELGASDYQTCVNEILFYFSKFFCGLLELSSSSSSLLLLLDPYAGHSTVYWNELTIDFKGVLVHYLE